MTSKSILAVALVATALPAVSTSAQARYGLRCAGVETAASFVLTFVIDGNISRKRLLGADGDAKPVTVSARNLVLDDGDTFVLIDRSSGAFKRLRNYDLKEIENTGLCREVTDIPDVDLPALSVEIPQGSGAMKARVFRTGDDPSGFMDGHEGER